MLLLGDCLDALPHWPDNTFDLVCTDPPYHLTQGSRNGSPRTNNPNSPFGRHRVGGERAIESKGFMGQEWDGGDLAFKPDVWREVLRVAKPGAYLTAFGGTRTYHRLACAIEDAGWEVRDCLMWLYGTGFPKSLDVSKALDKAAEANRAKLYDGYGTALKPSYEPVILARKPLVGTVAQNVQRYGTGGLNIDANRVHGGPSVGGSISGGTALGQGSGWNAHNNRTTQIDRSMAQGRWPPNVLLGHAADCTVDACQDGCPILEVDRQKPVASGPRNAAKIVSSFWQKGESAVGVRPAITDSGGASRFFPRFHYSAKASRKERAGSTHPTVKPLAVVEWLLRLTAPPGRPRVLDPFCGSGTTLIAAHRLGIEAVGIEREAEYVEQAYQRFTNTSRPTPETSARPAGPPPTPEGTGAG